MIALWLTKLRGWLFMAGAVVLVLVGAYAAGHRAAKQAAQADHNAKLIEGARNAMDARDRIAVLDSDTLRDVARERMRDSGKW